MSSLRNKALTSGFWSFFETFSNRGLMFVVSIILARLLTPEDFGTVGVLAIFIGMAGVLVDSGFKTSIIRTKNLTNVDCSTIFYVNLVVSIVVVIIIFSSANAIASFFDKPVLVSVIRVFAFLPVINGLGLVQAALLFKNLEFKKNAQISIVSNIFSGGIAIYLAYKGFSYWALVWKTFLVAAIYNLLLWVTSKWYPTLTFSLEILKKHFRFSSRLLMTGIIDSFFDNIYSFIFGKYFSFSELGFFTKGKSFVDMLTKTISRAIQKVSTPLLFASARDQEHIMNAYKKILGAICLIIFPVTAILVAVAEPFIFTLLGEQWLPAVPFFQILAISGMIYPILNANSSLFEVTGRSDYILRFALISRPVQIFILLITFHFGALMVARGIVFHYAFLFFLSFYFVKKIPGGQFLQIYKSIFIPLLLAGVTGVAVYLSGIILKTIINTQLLLLINLFIGGFVFFLCAIMFKVNELALIKEMLMKRNTYNPKKRK